MLNIENLYVKGFEMEYLINYKYQNVLYRSSNQQRQGSSVNSG